MSSGDKTSLMKEKSNETTMTTTTTTSHSLPSSLSSSSPSDRRYIYHSANDLTVASGAALIVADCMGTGILALPNDLRVLGTAFGLFFLIVNLPINYYAGSILHRAARSVESRTNDREERRSRSRSHGDDGYGDRYDSVGEEARTTSEHENDNDVAYHRGLASTHTFDFIGITHALFDRSSDGSLSSSSSSSSSSRVSTVTYGVAAVYYTNIFLVLGNYVLVMSHAVAAVIGEDAICLPTAGLIASVLMFAVSQLRTMAGLGRSASVVSLAALTVVVVQCLAAARAGETGVAFRDDDDDGETSFGSELFARFAALSSIGFAVGSQKLLLNIRHEFANRDDSTRSLAWALGGFGTAYAFVCLTAGDDPPPFLFDAVPSGSQRRVAGLFLWIHVAVSYAINSQALCSSLERVFHDPSNSNNSSNNGRATTRFSRLRWAGLTFLVAAFSYSVANAVPFFKDLVSLIGALTSIPLTLLLPAVYHRRATKVPVSSNLLVEEPASGALLIFSLIFTAVGVVGSIVSVVADWAHETTARQ